MMAHSMPSQACSAACFELHVSCELPGKAKDKLTIASRDMQGQGRC